MTFLQSETCLLKALRILKANITARSSLSRFRSPTCVSRSRSFTWQTRVWSTTSRLLCSQWASLKISKTVNSPTCSEVKISRVKLKLRLQQVSSLKILFISLCVPNNLTKQELTKLELTLESSNKVKRLWKGALKRGPRTQMAKREFSGRRQSKSSQF